MQILYHKTDTFSYSTTLSARIHKLENVSNNVTILSDVYILHCN